MQVPGLKIDPWDPPPVFMTPEQRAEKRRELNAKLVLDISAVNKSRSTTTSLSPSPTKERIQVDAPATVAAAAIRPLPAVTASMIVLTGSDHHYTAVPKTSQDWDDDADDADEKEDDMDDAEEMYAAHSWEDGDSNEAENMDTPLIGSPLTSPVPSSRLSSSHGGNSSSLNSAVRAHSRAHRILRSVRSRKSSLGMGRRGSVAHHRSTGADDHRYCKHELQHSRDCVEHPEDALVVAVVDPRKDARTWVKFCRSNRESGPSARPFPSTARHFSNTVPTQSSLDITAYIIHRFR